MQLSRCIDLSPFDSQVVAARPLPCPLSADDSVGAGAGQRGGGGGSAGGGAGSLTSPRGPRRINRRGSGLSGRAGRRTRVGTAPLGCSPCCCTGGGRSRDTRHLLWRLIFGGWGPRHSASGCCCTKAAARRGVCKAPLLLCDPRPRAPARRAPLHLGEALQEVAGRKGACGKRLPSPRLRLIGRGLPVLGGGGVGTSLPTAPVMAAASQEDGILDDTSRGLETAESSCGRSERVQAERVPAKWVPKAESAPVPGPSSSSVQAKAMPVQAKWMRRPPVPSASSSSDAPLPESTPVPGPSPADVARAADEVARDRTPSPPAGWGLASHAHDQPYLPSDVPGALEPPCCVCGTPMGDNPWVTNCHWCDGLGHITCFQSCARIWCTHECDCPRHFRHHRCLLWGERDERGSRSEQRLRPRSILGLLSTVL